MAAQSVRDGSWSWNSCVMDEDPWGLRLVELVGLVTSGESRILEPDERWVFPSAEELPEVQVLAAHGCPGLRSIRHLVRVLAYTGIRWGEAAALRVGRVDLQRRRLSIDEATSEVGG